MSDDQLHHLREQIDKIDLKIQQLLNQRAECAKKVADVKLREAVAKAGDEPQFYRPEREAQILRKVIERNQGPLDGKEVAHIFREIMSACLALEKPVEVAYLGPPGTFTEVAALKHFGHAIVTRPMANISEIFSAVHRKVCSYGVLPVENSTEGMVAHTLDNFINSPLKICGELELPIALHLLAQDNTELAKISRICAHQQALAQSRNWLQQNCPGIEVIAVSSNGEAARMAAEDRSIAAVAGELAAERYSLVQLASDIQDYADNTTRFLIVGETEVPPSGSDKTSLLVSVSNAPGALYKLLEPLAQQGISLTRIETRPSRTENWAYVFFMEFQGHQRDSAVKQVVELLRQQAHMVKVLGSYPAAVI